MAQDFKKYSTTSLALELQILALRALAWRSGESDNHNMAHLSSRGLCGAAHSEIINYPGLGWKRIESMPGILAISTC